jgi:hypothetical protein
MMVAEGGMAMEFSPGIIAFIFAVQLISYTIKGLIGFGNPLISGPLLSMRLDNVLITPGTLLLDCPVNAWITWKNRRSFQWRRIAALLGANLLGVIPGTLLLQYSMPWVLKTCLGVVVVALGVEMAPRGKTAGSKKKDRRGLMLAVSFFSGMCAGLFGINMFIVAYLERASSNYEEFKGSMCCLFFGENAFRLLVYLAEGIYTREVLLFSLCSLPAAIAAMVISALVTRRLDGQRLRPAAIVLFILGGVSIIVKSLPIF